jgi:putative hydrolase of the HAD superfamily
MLAVMAIRWIVFDWGDTLMSEAGPLDIPMAHWPTVHAIDGAAAVLSSLAEQYQLAVATNAVVSDRVLVECALERVALRQFIAALFCYRELGVKKVESAFWDIIVARLAVRRDELVMIGDNLEQDVLAPRRAGIAAVWFNWKRAPQPSGIDVPTITRLDALPSLIANMDLA